MKPLVFETIEAVSEWVFSSREKGAAIGFVPTMGALHQGHASLVKRALEENDRVITSIFVNPTQFNDPADLKHYPRTVEADLLLLGSQGCHAVFLPTVETMYPDTEVGHWDFGLLSSTLEGKMRPGHFDGVLTIVKKLFNAIPADRAYFGEKDFQQLALIRKMVALEKIPIQIVACPTLREPSGLAMSSRNTRLNQEELQIASHISRVLFGMKNRRDQFDPSELEHWARHELFAVNGLKLEYLEIVDPGTFAPLTDWSDYPGAIALCAARVGNVRLIDNIAL